MLMNTHRLVMISASSGWLVPASKNDNSERNGVRVAVHTSENFDSVPSEHGRRFVLAKVHETNKDTRQEVGRRQSGQEYFSRSTGILVTYISPAHHVLTHVRDITISITIWASLKLVSEYLVCSFSSSILLRLTSHLSAHSVRSCMVTHNRCEPNRFCLHTSNKPSSEYRPRRKVDTTRRVCTVHETLSDFWTKMLRETCDTRSVSPPGSVISIYCH